LFILYLFCNEPQETIKEIVSLKNTADMIDLTRIKPDIEKQLIAALSKTSHVGNQRPYHAP
jgi:hypothetical protein